MKRLTTTFLTLAFGLIAVETATVPASAQQVKSSLEIGELLNRQRTILESGQGGTAACPGQPDGDCGRGITIYKGDSAEGGSAQKQDPVVQSRPQTQTSGQTTAGTTITPSTGKRPRVASTAAVSVPRLPEGARLDLVILFDYDSAFIRPASRAQLSELCKAINNTASSDKFYIIGHTDAAGSSRYNLRLSQARAKEVKRHLVNECGISAARLAPVGMGEERLNPSFEPRSESQRRVEFMLNVS